MSAYRLSLLKVCHSLVLTVRIAQVTSQPDNEPCCPARSRFEVCVWMPYVQLQECMLQECMLQECSTGISKLALSPLDDV